MLNPTPEYLTWRGMIVRCTNPNATGYSRYGGAGIDVCERWMDFKNFHADMGDRPENHTLDRVDGSKGYSPSNCRWATRRQQCNNRKNNVRITHGGLTMTVAEWARHVGIKHVTLKQRLRRGWSADDALAIRPRTIKLTDKLGMIQEMVASGKGCKEVVAATGLSKGSYYNALKALQLLRSV